MKKTSILTILLVLGVFLITSCELQLQTTGKAFFPGGTTINEVLEELPDYPYYDQVHYVFSEGDPDIISYVNNNLPDLAGSFTMTEQEYLDPNQYPNEHHFIIITTNADLHGLSGTKIKILEQGEDHILYIAAENKNDLMDALDIIEHYQFHDLNTDCVEVSGSSVSPCTPLQECGNNIVEGEEECDDGNNVNGDGCSSECLIETTPEGLIAYYKLDGNTNDESGNGYHGTAYGASPVFVGRGEVYRFDGDDDYIQLPDDQNQFSDFDEITVSMWIKTYTSFASGHGLLRNSQSSSGFTIMFDGANGQNLDFYIAGVGSGYHSFEYPHGMSPGNWYHIATVYNGSAGKIYINGNLIGETLDEFDPLPSVLNKVKLGTLGGAGESFDGLIDEVKIYHIPLSDIEIQALYEEFASQPDVNYIDSCQTINEPGTYVLTGDIVDYESTCFKIESDQVSLDCRRHKIDGIDNLGSNGVEVASKNNVVISNCEITDWNKGIFLTSSTSSTIINNTLNSNREGIRAYIYSNYNTISNNDFRQNEYYGIAAYGSLYNMISDNYIFGKGSGLGDQYGILLASDSHNNTVYNNTLTNCDDAGIAIAYSNNNTIDSNIASEYNGMGIFLSYSQRNNIINNLANSNDGNGIFVFYSNYNSLIQNTVNLNGNSNSQSGIYLERSSNNILRDNIANNNTWGGGIFIDHSDNNQLIDNLLSYNREGIYVHNSGGNELNTNNLCSNNLRDLYCYSSESNNALSNTFDTHEGCTWADNGKIPCPEEPTFIFEPGKTYQVALPVEPILRNISYLFRELTSGSSLIIADNVMKWDNDEQRWDTYFQLPNGDWIGVDIGFSHGVQIKPGEGFAVFVKEGNPTAHINIEGSEITNPVPVTIKGQTSWIGIPYSDTSYTASILIDEIRLHDQTCTSVMRFDPDTGMGELYGYDQGGVDFNIEPDEGYKINCSPATNIVWIPGEQPQPIIPVSTTLDLIKSDPSGYRVVIAEITADDSSAATDLSGFFDGIGNTINDTIITTMDEDMIVVGGPCINEIAADLLGLDPGTCGAASTIPENKGIIQAFSNGGKTQILVAGWDSLQTRIAAQAVVRYLEFYGEMDTNRVETYGTNLRNDVNVGEGGTSTCGNSIIESGEECDDGNTASGDGCSGSCINEPKPNLVVSYIYPQGGFTILNAGDPDFPNHNTPIYGEIYANCTYMGFGPTVNNKVLVKTSSGDLDRGEEIGAICDLNKMPGDYNIFGVYVDPDNSINENNENDNFDYINLG